MSDWKIEGLTATKRVRGEVVKFEADKMSKLYALMEEFDEKEQQRAAMSLAELGRIVDQGMDKAWRRAKSEQPKRPNLRILGGDSGKTA